MSLGCLNYDIWYQVLACLRHDLSFPDKKKVRECRATILHVALASRTLNEPALSALWRSMDSLEPILRVINSFASGAGSAFLYCQTYMRQSHWVLREVPNHNVVASRVQDYLRRIRIFRLNGHPEREITLWSILSRFLGSSVPLLPNLQRLVITSSSKDAFPHDGLMLLLPNSLEFLEITEDEDSAPGYEPVLAFYKILIFHRVELRGITHRGAVSPELLSILCHSKALDSLSVEYKTIVTTCEKAPTILELLQRLPSLTNIIVDLGAVSLPTSLSSTPTDQFSLRNIGFRTTAEELTAFFRVGLRCLSVHSLNLYIHSTTNLSWEVVFKKIGLSFPKLEALHINIFDATSCPPLRMQDLEVLLPRNMTCLQLHNVPYQLTDQNLVTMLNAWPEIRSISLSGPGTSFSTSILAVASKLRSIQDFHIRTDPAHIPSAPPKVSPASENTLEEIRSALPQHKLSV